MRHQPIEAAPWELEAARRREVIESDFGAPHAAYRMDHERRSSATAGTIRRLASWAAALAQGNGPAPAPRTDHAAACQQGARAIGPSS